MSHRIILFCTLTLSLCGCGSEKVLESNLGTPSQTGSGRVPESKLVASSETGWFVRGLDLVPIRGAKVTVTFDNSEGAATAVARDVSLKLGLWDEPLCQPDCSPVEVEPGTIEERSYEGFLFGSEGGVYDLDCTMATPIDRAMVDLEMVLDGVEHILTVDIPSYCVYCPESEDCIYVPEPPPGW